MNTVFKSMSANKKPLLFSSLAGLFFGYNSYKSFLSKAQMASENIQQDKKKILRVCVTGATGNVATSFIPMLANGEVFGNDVKIHLKLLDIPENEHLLKGMTLELMDAAYPLLYGIEFGANPKRMFRDIDLGVFIGGHARKPGQERKDLLQINGQIFKEQGIALNNVAKKDVKCLVVANPVNTNCDILKSYAHDVPTENFTSLSRLDQNRAVGQLAAKMGVNPDSVKNVIVWGNHSKTLFPDARYGTIEGHPIRDIVNNDDYMENDFPAKVQNRGEEVLETKRAPATISGAKAIRDHLRDWYFGIPQGTMTSMGVTSDGSYGVEKGIVCSMPVVTRNFNYKIVKGLEITGKDQENFKRTVDELINERDIAFGGPIVGHIF